MPQNSQWKHKALQIESMFSICQHSLGNALLLPGEVAILFLAILDISPFIFLQALSNSTTLHCILCRFNLMSSFSSETLSASKLLYKTIWAWLLMGLSYTNSCVVGMVHCWDWEASAWTAIFGGILGLFARSLQASRVSFS